MRVPSALRAPSTGCSPSGGCWPSTPGWAATSPSSCSGGEPLVGRRRLHSGGMRLGHQPLLHGLEPLGAKHCPTQVLLGDVLLEVLDPVLGRRVIGEVLGEGRLFALHLLQLLEELNDALRGIPGLGRVPCSVCLLYTSPSPRDS